MASIIDSRSETGKTALILGSSMSGKTTLLVDLLNRIVDDYHVVVIFTQSPHAAPFKDLPKQVILCEGFHEKVVNLMFMINRETTNKYKFLVVLDDVMDVHSNKTLNKLLLIYRNSGISTIVSTQYCKLIGPKLRGSIHKVLITGSKSYEDRKCLLDLFLRTYLYKLKKDEQEKFIIKNTKLSPSGGKYILIDNVTVDMQIHQR